MTADFIEIRNLVRLLLQHKWKFFSIVFLAVIVSIATSFFVTKRYVAEALLMPVIADYQKPALSADLGNLGSLVGLNLGNSSSEAEEAIAILESNGFVRHFILEEELLGELHSVLGGAETSEHLSLNDAVNHFQQSVRSVRRVPNGNMIRLTIKWHDPDVATVWVEKQVKRLNETLRERAIETATKSVEYLRKQADETNNVELRQLIFQLIQDQIRSIMLAEVRSDYAFAIVDPPFVSDLDDYVSPDRALYALSGGFIGLLFGFLFVLRQADGRVGR